MKQKFSLPKALKTVFKIVRVIFLVSCIIWMTPYSYIFHSISFVKISLSLSLFYGYRSLYLFISVSLLSLSHIFLHFIPLFLSPLRPLDITAAQRFVEIERKEKWWVPICLAFCPIMPLFWCSPINERGFWEEINVRFSSWSVFLISGSQPCYVCGILNIEKNDGTGISRVFFEKDQE